MTDSTEPSKDKTTSPSYGFPYLQFYRGIFDCAYVSLNPFCTIPGIDPGDSIPETLKIHPEPHSLDLINKIAVEWRAIHARDPAIISNLEKQEGQSISWENIRNACMLANNGDLNRALLTNMHALKSAFKDESSAKIVSAYCASRKIFLPYQDHFSPIMERSLSILLKRLGNEWTTISDDLDFNQCSIRTDVLVEERRAWQHSGLVDFFFSKIYPPDNSFLVYVPYDTFTTVICGQELCLRKLGLEELFEGFWAAENTADDWWLSSPLTGQ